ncbi:MAG: hypothetical protein ACYYKD_07345 [Rhodospirillales bacterium]
MAEDTGLRAPIPVGGGGGQDGGGAYVKLKRRGADDSGDEGEGEQPPRERTPRRDGPEIKLAPGLREELPEAALLAFDRLNARLTPLQKERDTLREETARLRKAAETVPGLKAAGEYGVRIALQRILDNLRSLSGTPGLLLAAVSGLDVVAYERGLIVWRRAAVHALGVVRAASHPADTVGMLGGGVTAIVTLVGDRAALIRRGEEITGRFAAEPFSEDGRTWPLKASFGGAEIHAGAQVDDIIAAAEQARMEELTGGVALSGAPPEETLSAPARPSEPVALSDEDLDRLAVIGVIAPPRALASPPPDAGSGDDVG